MLISYINAGGGSAKLRKATNHGSKMEDQGPGKEVRRSKRYVQRPKNRILKRKVQEVSKHPKVKEASSGSNKTGGLG